MLTGDVHVQGTGSYREPKSHPAATEDQGRGRGPCDCGGKELAQTLSAGNGPFQPRREQSRSIGWGQLVPACGDRGVALASGGDPVLPWAAGGAGWPGSGKRTRQPTVLRTDRCGLQGAAGETEEGPGPARRASPSHCPLPSRFGQVHSSSVQNGPRAETTVRGNSNRRTLECFSQSRAAGLARASTRRESSVEEARHKGHTVSDRFSRKRVAQANL